MRCGVRIVAQLLLGVCLAVLGGCRYGEVGREGESGACDYVVKDADSFARDFGNLNEVRDVFNDKNLASYFEPEGGGFHMLTTKEYKSEYKVVYTDQQTFFSYWAECFMYTGGAHGGTIVKVGTIEVKTGKRLTTADVIPPEKRDEAIAKIREAVIAKIGGEENLMPSAKEVLSKLSENFYVGKDGLHFIFNEYEVACYAQGVVEVVIPASILLHGRSLAGCGICPRILLRPGRHIRVDGVADHCC